jgi:hypothetical protein
LFPLPNKTTVKSHEFPKLLRGTQLDIMKARRASDMLFKRSSSSALTDAPWEPDRQHAAHVAARRREIIPGRRRADVRAAAASRIDIKPGEFVSIMGRRARANRRCCTSSACTTAPGRVSTR